MENQHQKIDGYRDLTQDEIDAINEIKRMATEVERLTKTVQGISTVDKRWHSIGVTNLQQGFMALTRAIARPTTF